MTADHPSVFAYLRNTDHEKLLVVNNFYDQEVEWSLPDQFDFDPYNHQILISNYSDSVNKYDQINLRPYESIVFHLTK